MKKKKKKKEEEEEEEAEEEKEEEEKKKRKKEEKKGSSPDLGKAVSAVKGRATQSVQLMWCCNDYLGYSGEMGNDLFLFFFLFCKAAGEISSNFFRFSTAY